MARPMRIATLAIPEETELAKKVVWAQTVNRPVRRDQSTASITVAGKPNHMDTEIFRELSLFPLLCGLPTKL